MTMKSNIAFLKLSSTSSCIRLARLWMLLFFEISAISSQKALALTTTPAQQLRSLIHQSRDRAILLPGVHDALSASTFQQSGAECLFLSGFGVSATYLGAPDAGILALNEMEDTARRVMEAINRQIPVIVDGDTGYGSCHNMRRAIRGLAHAGAAAISIEDQVFPKKCTYSAGEKGAAVVSRDASVARIQTALAAAKEAWEQDGNQVLIVARTDCRASQGLQEAISRCLAYENLGADIVYAENLLSPKEYQMLRSALSPETTTILAQVQLNEPNTQQKLYSLSDIHQMGYNLGLFGVTALQATVKALQHTAAEMLRNEGIVPSSHPQSLASFSNLKKVVGFPDLEEFEREHFCE
jgi:2-methylisocitrate lyase-like PEP mutase family enzyme